MRDTRILFFYVTRAPSRRRRFSRRGLRTRDARSFRVFDINTHAHTDVLLRGCLLINVY